MRAGRISSIGCSSGVAFSALAILAAACGRGPAPGGPDTAPAPLRAYVGAGLRRAFEAAAEAFTRETRIAVEGDYGGSGMILSRARLDPDADLFLPGDVWYVDRLQEETGLVRERLDVASMVPVIIVRKGNPTGIGSLEDLFRAGVKVGLGNPKSCQVGRIADEILSRIGRDRSPLEAKESVTVEELGVWVKTGHVDAAIVWDVTARAIADSADAIDIPPEVNATSRLTAAILTTSKHPQEARRFLEFLAGAQGRAILKAHGLTVPDGPATGSRK
jgi:molybdate transport system substrate-binding protein